MLPAPRYLLQPIRYDLLERMLRLPDRANPIRPEPALAIAKTIAIC
jgi:hypothetical protein